MKESADYHYAQGLAGLPLLNASYNGEKMLLAGNTLLDTALTCGFSDLSHLNQHFKKWLGIPPREFQPNNISRS
ncbi:hypothetical protein GARC_4077 [Paraglaciecola arctica BSs20135]|uniref:HTH araC/xylS-type domain-containing protein n=1 Tax=Paraglaciecola arctica BSs20135 TaxID=493475 RepID=K6YAP1_9ALTE|nr:hypothetical protein GARC_4077 [Paraglaciecola arctica BSs20135]